MVDAVGLCVLQIGDGVDNAMGLKSCLSHHGGMPVVSPNVEKLKIVCPKLNLDAIDVDIPHIARLVSQMAFRLCPKLVNPVQVMNDLDR